MIERQVMFLCPAGTEIIVSRVVVHDFPGFDVQRVSSGFVLGTTSASEERIRLAPYATNVFEIITQTPRGKTLQEVAQLVAAVGGGRPGSARLGGTFRIRIFGEGTFTPLGHAGPVLRLARTLERRFKARYDSRGGGTEFWVIRRRDEPSIYLGRKLSGANPRTPKGTLRPELAAALVRCVDLRGAHVLDPFAGSGTIGVAALDAGAERVWINDKTPNSLQIVEQLPSAKRRMIRVSHLDIRELADPAKAVTAIVTDPPWGLFESEALPRSAEVLHLDLLDLAARLLPVGGVLIVLTGIGEPMAARSHADERFDFEASSPVLVNGKKAVVLVGARR